MKVLIFGASGSGTTTLAKSLAESSEKIHLDADDYYWAQTTVPFEKKIAPDRRVENLRKDFEKHKNVFVSGSLVSWGEYWETAFDLAVFLKLPPAVRMERLRRRELQRYGDKLRTDPMLRKKSLEFLQWAKQYDDVNFKGRSIRVHEAWMQKLECELLIITGDKSIKERKDLVFEKMARFEEE